MAPFRRRGWSAVGAVVAFGLLVQAVFSFWGGVHVVRVVDDLGCAVASAAASASCFVAARRRGRRYRASWTWLAAGAAFWTAGDLAWSWSDLIAHVTPKPPAVSDLGFLLFPACAAVGLWVLPTAEGRGRLRRWLDGVMIGSALLLVSWTTVLGSVWKTTGGYGATAATTLLAYPLLDVVLLTMVALAATRIDEGRTIFYCLAGGLTTLALADSGFAWLTSHGAYRPGAWCDTAFIFGFLIMAVVPQLPAQPRSRPAVPALHDQTFVELASTIPYLPLTAAGIAVVSKIFQGDGIRGLSLVLIILIVGCLFARQRLVMRQNRALLARLKESALTDPLTGLANRALFSDRVAHAVALHARDLRPLALVYADVDDFKVVNDSLGHVAGDELLRAIAERLRGAVRVGDTLARLGGDEFAVLIEDGATEPSTVALRILQALTEPFRIAGHSFTVRASVGLAEVEADAPATTAEELLTHADVAMYAAKQAGKGRVVTFHEGLALEEGDLHLRECVEEAVREERFVVHYQPVVDALSGRLVAVEALTRMLGSNGELIPPGRFLPVVEACKLTGEVGRQVLDAALRQLGLWSAERGDNDLVVAVNLFPEQLRDRNLCDLVAERLAFHGVRPSQLVLEITEGALLTDHLEAIQVAQGLVRLGVRLALDDFGTGYSSLTHLRGFPLYSLKIDKAFVQDSGVATNAAFLNAIARMSHDLGLIVVAEGVENPEHLAAVRRAGCDHVQGWLTGRPVPAERLDVTSREAAERR